IPFAMGVVEEPGKSEIREHLARGCESCTAGIREARRMAFALGASAGSSEPSRRLRSRVLAAAGAETAPRWHWRTAWQAAAAVAVLALAVVAYQAGRERSETASLRSRAERSGAEAATLREALAFLQASDTRDVSFGQGAPAPPRGRVFYNRSGVLLLASNLPSPPTGKAYEMWIIPKGGKPAPAGLFASGSSGTALHLYRPPAPVSTTDTVAVTLEAATGADAPTSQPLFAVTL
ncbi:MAG TPA: anti-sigma factor, partial [Bryobacteraceae bacterium]|nr:anti-sigma factor [Bryobacteraceae bacterium]